MGESLSTNFENRDSEDEGGLMSFPFVGARRRSCFRSSQRSRCLVICFRSSWRKCLTSFRWPASAVRVAFEIHEACVWWTSGLSAPAVGVAFEEAGVSRASVCQCPAVGFAFEDNEKMCHELPTSCRGIIRQREIIPNFENATTLTRRSSSYTCRVCNIFECVVLEHIVLWNSTCNCVIRRPVWVF